MVWMGSCWMGCSNDLTIDPSDQYSEDTYWKDENEAMAAITGC